MNNRTNVLEGLKIETSLDTIRIGTFPNEVCFAPGEADAFTSLVGMARGMAGMKKLPPFIQSSPFRAYFDKASIVFVRKGQKGNGLKTNFEESDKLVRATRVAIEMYRDAQIHRGEPGNVMGATAGEVHDPGFDGLV
jgi:hypothetical protein